MCFSCPNLAQCSQNWPNRLKHEFELPFIAFAHVDRCQVVVVVKRRPNACEHTCLPYVGCPKFGHLANFCAWKGVVHGTCKKHVPESMCSSSFIKFSKKMLSVESTSSTWAHQLWCLLFHYMKYMRPSVKHADFLWKWPEWSLKM